MIERVAGPWVEYKLQIVWRYMWGFATACSGKAPEWNYVDGLAGSGVNSINDSDLRLPGSPILALETDPQFARCLLMESNSRHRAALTARTRPYGDRAIVEPGNCNRDLLPAMRSRLDRRAPCLCVLDPEGSEVEWSTVREIAGFREGKTKAEQFILLPTDTGFIRNLPLDPQKEPTAGAARRLTLMFGNDEWRDIYARRRSHLLTPDAAREEYVKLYARGLKEELRYRYALDFQIFRAGGKGHPMYFLIFATDHPDGKTIMAHCFDTGYPEEVQGALFPLPRRRRLED